MSYMLLIFIGLCCQFVVNLALDDAFNNLSPTMQHNLQCGNFTYDKCTLDLDGFITAQNNSSPDQCQFYCNIIYQDVCKFSIFDNEKKECRLFAQSIEEHIRTCDQRAGTTEPNVDDCFADSNLCNLYHQEECIYKGKEIGYFPGVDSISLCQQVCTNTPPCAYFLYDFNFKDCQLFDSGERECEFLVWPASPTFAECNEELTTSPITTTNIPSPCTSHAYNKSDGTCACAFFLQRGLTWHQAAEQCVSFGAKLPEIYTAEENTDIFNLKPPDTGVFLDGMWLGASDLQTVGTYIWETTGQPLSYSNWSPAQPDQPGGERCLHMWLEAGEWNNIRCHYTVIPQAAMCEKIISCGRN